MKKRTKRLGSLGVLGAIAFSLFGGLASSSPAVAEEGMYSCSNTPEAIAEIEEVTKLSFNDVVNVKDWISKRYSYCITIDIGDTGRYVAIQAPNLQQMLVNQLGGLVLESGYAMSPDKVYSTSINNGSTLDTVLDKGIPNPMYQGEFPLVTIALGDMILEDNIFEQIKSGIEFLFGGSLVSPPSKSDMEASLRYVNPDDFSSQVKTVSSIILEHKDRILGWDEGQCLIEIKNDECSFQGKSFLSHDLLDDLITDNSLSLGQIRQKLGERVGSKFVEVQWSIAALLDIKGTQIERSMPIDQANLITPDKQLFAGMQDERTAPKPVGSFSYYAGTFLMTVSTWFTDWTESIQSFISWDWVDDTGILNILSAPIIRFILAFIAVIFVWKIMLSIIRVVRDNSSSSAWAGLLSSLLMLAFISWAAISPATIQNFGKATISVTDTLAEEVAGEIATSSAGSFSEVCGDNPTQECIYKIPHFDTWTRLQFGVPVSSPDMAISTADKNIIGDKIPKVNGTPIDNWSYYASSMMATDDRNVYRAVDHFVAPTINIGGDGRVNTDNPYTNNATGGTIQELSGLGSGLLSFLLTIEIWAMKLIQLLVFLELVFILALFILFAFRGWSDNEISQPFKLFGWSLAKNLIYPLITAIILTTMLAASSRSTVENGIMQFILFAVIWLAWKPIKRSGLLPMHQLLQSSAVSGFLQRGVNTLKYAGSRMIRRGRR